MGHSSDQLQQIVWRDALNWSMADAAHNMNEAAREVTFVLPGSWTMVNSNTLGANPVTHWLPDASL